MTQSQVSITSTNGLDYTCQAGKGGRLVEFEIPPTVKFMDGANSYLNFEVKLALGAQPTRLQLDPQIGGQSLIKNVRIYSGSRNVLLEEVSDYNTKVAMEYSYDQDESMRKMRALKEGSTVGDPKSRGTLGTSESQLINISSNPYFVNDPVPAGRNYGNLDFTTVKCCLPLHTGIFADSKKIFPVMATQGLFIEIDLEDASRVVKTMDSVNRWRRIQQNPLFHGVDAAGTQWPADSMTTTQYIFLNKQNNITSVSSCPFVKGEPIGICSKTDPNLTAQIQTGAGVQTHGVITDITMSGGFVRLELQAALQNRQLNGTNITSGNFVVFSAAVDGQRNDTAGLETMSPYTAYDTSYTVSDMSIVCQQVSLDDRYEKGMLAKLREGGAIEFDILSATNYKHSLLSSNRNATVNLPLSNTRAKSIICIPTDASSYTVPQLIGGCRGNGAGLTDTNIPYAVETLAMDGRLQSNRTGLEGIIDNLTDYQWVIDDKLTPSRPVSVSKVNGGKSISAQHLCEVEKSLNAARIVPRSFCDYNRNFICSRGYALNDGVSNLNNKTNQLQLFYNERTAAGVDKPPTKNKLLMCFVYHLRRILIKGDSVQVIV